MTMLLQNAETRQRGAMQGRRMLAGAAVLLLALSGCAPEPDEQAANGGVNADGGSSPTQTAPSETASPSPTTEPTTAPPTSDAPQTGSPGACLVGAWLASNEFFLAGMREYGGDQVSSVTGEVVLTFAADGSLTTDYQEWEITAFEDGSEVVIHRDGVDSGEYSVTGELLSFADTSMGTTISVSAAGMSVELPTTPAEYRDLPFSCDASTLTMSTPEGDFPMERR